MGLINPKICRPPVTEKEGYIDPLGYWFLRTSDLPLNKMTPSPSYFPLVYQGFIIIFSNKSIILILIIIVCSYDKSIKYII